MYWYIVDCALQAFEIGAIIYYIYYRRKKSLLTWMPRFLLGEMTKCEL